MLDGWIQDVRLGLRASRKAPAFTLLVLATLAVGIGATTAIFTLVESVLLSPLPYEESESLAMVFRTAPRFGLVRSVASFPDFADWRNESESFTDLAAYSGTRMTFLEKEGAERWRGIRATAELLPMLGVSPSIGRVFEPAEDQPGAERVIVLSHALWQSRFGSDPGLVGRVIVLGGEPHTVLGVMPADFAYPSRDVEFWMPLRGDGELMDRDANFLSVLGRLEPGVSVAEAQTEMEALAARIDQAAPQANKGFGEGYGVFVESRHAFLVRNARTGLLVFLGAVAMVLAVACASVSNLMLARGASRRREMAVRAALGAGRGRLVRQLLTESLVLAALGGALGIGVAVGVLRVLLLFGSDQIPRVEEIGIDTTALAFTAIVALGCGIASGTIPAGLASQANLRHPLQEGGLGRVGRRLQQTFVVAQVAVALILSVGAGLLGASFARLTSVETGFDPRQVVAAQVAFPEPGLGGAPLREETMARMREAARERTQFFEKVLAGAESLPGVEAAGLTYGLPFGARSFGRIVVPEGMEVLPGEEPVIEGNVVAGDYFRTMGMSLRIGRGLTRWDTPESPLVAVVNEAMTELFWPNDSPIGKRMHIGGENAWITVVGVVADVRQHSLAEDPRPMYYRSLAQALGVYGMFVAVRSRIAPSDQVSGLRRVVRGLDPRLPLTDVSIATDLIEASVASPRLRTLVLASFGAVAVALALVSIYGMIAFAVGHRSHEIAIRMALGAGKGRVIGMVVGNGLGLSVWGVVIGVGGSLALTRFLEGMLFGITPYDASTYAIVSVILAAVAAAACWIPARRAAKIEPMALLRSE